MPAVSFRTALGGKIGAGNLKHTISMIATQLEHHKKSKGKAASGYLKLVLVLTGSCVETLVYRLVRLALKNGKKMPIGSWEYINAKPLHKEFVTKKGGEVVICRRKKRRIKLTSKIDFKKLNSFAKQMGLVDQTMFERLEKIRDTRNRIHLSALTSIDTNYTVADVQEGANTVDKLLDLIDLERSR